MQGRQDQEEQLSDRLLLDADDDERDPERDWSDLQQEATAHAVPALSDEALERQRLQAEEQDLSQG